MLKIEIDLYLIILNNCAKFEKILQSVLNLETTRGQTDVQTDGLTDGH